MKNIKNFLLPLALFCFALTACTKSDDGSSSSDDNSSSSSNTPPAAGQWKITYFFDKKDETSNYSGYTFEFGTAGSLKASNGSQSWTGTWKTGYDDSKNKFLIDFSGSIPSALSELEEDWLILKKEDKLLHFEHTSGGNGDTDILKFEKK
jgi:hypothetical protein